MRPLALGTIAVALALSAWSALGAVQAHDTTHASALLAGDAGSIGPRRAAEVRSLLDTAGTLNPDLTVELLRGQLALAQHLNAAALRTIASVARREPLNLQAWSQLAFAAARAGDRALLVIAARHVSELYPTLR